ncbi:restriction endonuclease subunit S [Flavobacterium sp. NRK F10]|uniref:restriction endonuclease subunit S n=1 Tax=Flavobacterium sp. NRK F10 TaxID=2954931 RepID=UPI002091B355|nr:restriction endonuclease subunit S [Flavobacterium sp. NRK F10]MCO6173586.1 restriction endonuclease subunit S [Flavobacterium sp. NRK F10]
MSKLWKKRVIELVDVFNNIRIPLSSKQRENIDKIYPYYGAQGIVDYVDNYLFDGEYILIAEDGENLRSNNQNICNIVNKKFWVNNHAHIVKANFENNTKYLYYNFNRIKFEPYVTGSAQPKLNKENLLNIETYVHSLSEQQKIAKVLSDLDAKIDLNNKINSELEVMAKTLYDYWFVQFDFPFDFAQGKPIISSLSHRAESRCEKPYKSSGGKMVYNKELKREVPEGWEVGTLLDISTFTNGLACQKFRPKENEDYYKVIKIREMGSGFTENSEFVSTNIPEKVIVYNGDILFSWSATLDVKIWTGGIGGLNQHIFKVTSKKYPKSYYYFELLNYLQHFKMIAELRKTTMGHITQDHLKESRIAIPPMELIQKSDKIISPILEKKVKLYQENQELASLRDWLLPMLMNGQVTVGETVDIEDREELKMIVENPEAKVLSLQDKKLRRKMLATFIVNQSLSDPSFGKTKFEKLLHLIEYHIVKNDYNQRYSVQTAGPYDGGFTNVFWDEVIRSKWFRFEELGNLKRIVAGENHVKSLVDYGYFSDDLKESISRFISLFKLKNYKKAEVVSTLYAVWNNRLIKNEMITDALLKKDFLEWDKQKAQYAKDLESGLNWMRSENIIPNGWGKYISRAKSKKK